VIDFAALTDTVGSPAATIEIVLGLLIAATALAMAARRIGLPYPIVLVLGGLVLGFVPGLPEVELEPDLVFVLFLPPILFGAGYFTSIRDLKANLRPILLLAVGLVLFTTAAVAIVAHALVPGLGWPAAVALGAIVSPPDAVAATAILQRLGVPRRVVTILEGESLLNDATALVTYRLAVAAVLTGSFSAVAAGTDFVVVAVGGVLLGVIVGWIVARIVGWSNDPVFSVVITFLAPLAAYLPAETLGVSGVLSTVTAGIVLGREAPRRMGSEVRVAGLAVWQVLIFLINGAVFTLIGLQLPIVLDGLTGFRPEQLAFLGAAIASTVVIARIVWVYPATYLPRLMSAKLRARDPIPPNRVIFIIAWAGLRGVVSLAAALALPPAFPERSLIIFLTLVVILVTLVGQGLTLPVLTRRLGVIQDGGAEAHETAEARMTLAHAAVERIDGLADDWPGHQELIDALRGVYTARTSHYEPQESLRGAAEEEQFEHRQIRSAVIDAEREALLELRERGAVSDEVFRSLERDLDLEELRMEA
jgi:monovalent cation/hydrogen antiporter